MPNRNIHRPVSGTVGAGYAGYKACRRYKGRPAATLPIAAETVGGFAGGWVGGALPDIIDPPTSPNHRDVGHGIATSVGAIAWTADALLDLQERLRRQADRLEANYWRLQSDFERTLSTIMVIFLRFLAGALDGLVAGYAAHLTLDFCTPSGLPLIARSC